MSIVNNNYFWWFKSALPLRLCDEIIKYGNSKQEIVGKIGGLENNNLSKEETKKLKRKRNSDIVWLNDTWIYKEIHPFVHEANKNAGWNFEWDWSEPIQFTKYKLNQYYDWHCDSFDIPHNDLKNLKTYGKNRKLSVTCQLTDGSEYTGGELQFDFRNYDPHLRDENKHVFTLKEVLPKGSIVVFPSFVWHRVKPVTKGTRYSLVMWNLGYPFK